MKRIAVLTGGGDAPGLNAVIRAVVKTAINLYGCEVLGVRDGYDGFISDGGVSPLDLASVRGILPRGGTILGTANRGNPFARKVASGGEQVVVDVSDQIVAAIHALALDALIVIGGDGTLRIATELAEKGVPVVGVPKTIDNDIGGTEVTFGFDTALTIATEALDRLHTTAEAHHRVMVLELMGRDAGFIALHAGVPGGADVVLIPEIPFKLDSVVKKVRERAARGSAFSLVAVSEGAKRLGGESIYARPGDAMYVPRLGGIGQAIGTLHRGAGVRDSRDRPRPRTAGRLADGLRSLAGDALWRGGCPDRGSGGFGRMVALRNGQVIDIPLDEALAVPRRVDLGGDAVATARGLGISFGDD